MKELMKYYEEFERIMGSYRGERTDWSDKCDKLERLVKKVSDVKIRNSKNMFFYSWIKEKLREDVREEFLRVWKITIFK